MTEHSPEFLAEYPKHYRNRWNAPVAVDFARCCDTVYSTFGSGQCSRKNGHGPHGAYCKQHDPVAIKAKADAQNKILEAHRDARLAELDAIDKLRRFEAECAKYVRAVAAGMTDENGGTARKIVAGYDGMVGQ